MQLFYFDLPNFVKGNFVKLGGNLLQKRNLRKK